MNEESGRTRHHMEEGEGKPPSVIPRPRHPALRVRSEAFYYDNTHTVSAFPASSSAQTASVLPCPGGAPGGGAYLGNSYCGGGGYCSSGAGGGPLGCFPSASSHHTHSRRDSPAPCSPARTRPHSAPAAGRPGRPRGAGSTRHPRLGAPRRPRGPDAAAPGKLAARAGGGARRARRRARRAR
jgi:hypothetical protein